MAYVQSSLEVYTTNQGTYPSSDSSSVTVYTNSPSTYSLPSDTTSIDVYVTSPSTYSVPSDTSSLTVYANPPASYAVSDTSSLIVYLSGNQSIATLPSDTSSITVYTNAPSTVQPSSDTSSLTVYTTNPTTLNISDTQSITVYTTGTSSRSNYATSSLTVGITGLTSTNFVEVRHTVFITGDPALPFAESSLVVIKYDTKYGDIRFTYPKGSNQPLGFEVVVYKALNGEFDPNDKDSYLTPLREVKQSSFISQTDDYYVYKAAWTPKAIDTTYPFKIAVRSVFFSGKSSWNVSGPHDI